MTENHFADEVRRQIQRLWITVVAVGVFALGAVVFAAFAVSGQLSHKASYSTVVRKFEKAERNLAHAFRTAERNSCVGENITRATDNSSHLADFHFEMQQITFTKSTLRADYVALAKLGINRKVLNLALEHSEASLRSEQVQAATKVWTSFTNCSVAPSLREAPAVHQMQAVLPPKSAMSVKNALKLDPVGSVGG